jgi:hypothetical protein
MGNGLNSGLPTGVAPSAGLMSVSSKLYYQCYLSD